jgi:hypothetical protein
MVGVTASQTRKLRSMLLLFMLCWIIESIYERIYTLNRAGRSRCTLLFFHHAKQNAQLTTAIAENQFNITAAAESIARRREHASVIRPLYVK